jgi:hypothetical protein
MFVVTKIKVVSLKKNPVRTTGFIFQYFKVHRQELTFGWALMQRYDIKITYTK